MGPIPFRSGQRRTRHVFPLVGFAFPARFADRLFVFFLSEQFRHRENMWPRLVIVNLSHFTHFSRFNMNSVRWRDLVSRRDCCCIQHRKICI